MRLFRAFLYTTIMSTPCYSISLDGVSQHQQQHRVENRNQHRKRRPVDFIDYTPIKTLDDGNHSIPSSQKKVRLVVTDEHDIERTFDGSRCNENNNNYYIYSHRDPWNARISMPSKVSSPATTTTTAADMMTHIDLDDTSIENNDLARDWKWEEANKYACSYNTSHRNSLSFLNSTTKYGSPSYSGDTYSSDVCGLAADPLPVKKTLVLSDYYSFQRPVWLRNEDKRATTPAFNSRVSGIFEINKRGAVLNMEVDDSEPIQRDAVCSTCLSSFGISTQQSQLQQQDVANSKQPKSCYFCMKSYCEDTCVLPCDMCAEFFCRNCSTPNYDIAHGGIHCIECSNECP